MTPKQIDYLIEWYEHSYNLNKIVDYIEDDELKKKIENFKTTHFWDYEKEAYELEDLILSNLITQIEKEGYDYFYTKIFNHPDFAVELLSRVSDKKKIIEIIKSEKSGLDVFRKVSLLEKCKDKALIKEVLEDEEITWLTEYSKLRLVESTQDKEFMKECVRNPELRLGISEKVALMRLIADKEFIKDCIKDSQISIVHKCALVRDLGDKEVIKEFIKNCIDDNRIGTIRYEIIHLIKLTGDKEYIKKCVKNVKLELSSEDKKILIEITQDKDFIKKCIKDDSLKLTPANKMELIGLIGEEKYIKECIEDNSLGLESKMKRVLMYQINDNEYIKESIKNNNIALSSADKCSLIVLIGGNAYVKECVEDETLGLTSLHKARLIEYIDDKEYIKECVKNEKLGLDTDDKADLIRLTKDKEYIKTCIKDDTLGITLDEKIELIIGLEDIEYIKECVNDTYFNWNASDKVALILETKDTIYIKEYIEKCIKNDMLGLDTYNMLDLISGTDDGEYIKECMRNDKLKLDNDDKVFLILEMRDKEYIKECVKDLSLGLTKDDKRLLILKTEDEEYIKACIEDDSLEFDVSDRICLILGTCDNDYIDEKMKKISNEDKTFTLLIASDSNMLDNYLENILVRRNFKLPEEMTIGMEIESEGFFSEELENKFNFCDWKSKYDGSLMDGVEIVSPILSPTEERVRQIYLLNESLSKLGQSVSERCGGHIHIGANYLTSKQAYINLMEIWCNTEKILYVISNEENTAPRYEIAEYAKPISQKVRKSLEKGTLSLTDESDLNEFIYGLKEMQGKISRYDGKMANRYFGINFLNVSNRKNTIEFRLANGTLNPDLWMDNINLFGGIVAVSEELSKIFERGIESEDDRVKIEMFDKLKTDIDETKKLDILLKLVGVEPTEYKKRYDSNVKLIDSEFEMLELFSDVKGPIDIMEKIKMKSVCDVACESSALLEREVMENITLLTEKSKDKYKEP